MSGLSCFQSPLALRGFQFTVSNLPRRQEARVRRWQPPPEGASSWELSLLQVSGPRLARGLGNSACSGCSASDTLAFPARILQSGSLWSTLSSSLLVLPVGSILIVSPFLWPFPSAQWKGSERSQESAGPACFAHHEAGLGFLTSVETTPPRSCSQERAAGDKVPRARSRNRATKSQFRSPALQRRWG